MHIKTTFFAVIVLGATTALSDANPGPDRTLRDGIVKTITRGNEVDDVNYLPVVVPEDFSAEPPKPTFDKFAGQHGAPKDEYKPAGLTSVPGHPKPSLEGSS